MLDRSRRTVVDTYIGAIALGLLLAQAVEHFVGIFSAPVAAWVAQNNYREMTQKPAISSGFPLEAALPEVVRSILLVLLFYSLIRWLYSRAAGSDVTE
jgi:ABC-type sulfate transport system permease component